MIAQPRKVRVYLGREQTETIFHIAVESALAYNRGDGTTSRPIPQGTHLQ